MKNKKKFA